MVREYVGARYVPMFSNVNGGVWSNIYEYEALTIVKNGTDFYTSRKKVPIGIDISNTEFWVLTGDYNGAISGLNDRMEEVEKEVKDIAPLDLIFPKLVQNVARDSVGICGVIKCKDGEGIIFDFGAVESASNICGQLIDAGITKIKAAFISHYHMDHISDVTGLSTFKSLLDMSSTVFYSAICEEAIISRYNDCRAIFPDNIWIFPDDGDVITFDDVEVTCYNCGESANDYWDLIASGDGNDYSMVCYINYYDNCVFMTADAPQRVQDKLVSDGHYRPAQLVTAPHHAYNTTGSENLALETGAEIIYASDTMKNNWYEKGTKDPFICALGHYSARYYSQTLNAEAVVFSLRGSAGIDCSVGHYDFVGQYDDSDVITVYVDNSKALSNLNIGSQDHPYPSLMYALTHIRQDLRYKIILQSDETENIIIAHKDVIIDGNNHSVGNLTIRNSFANVDNLIAGTVSVQKSTALFTNITLNSFAATDAHAIINGFTTRQNTTNLFGFYHSVGSIYGTFNNAYTITNLVAGTHSSVTVAYTYNASDGITNIFDGNSTNDYNGPISGTLDALKKIWANDDYKICYNQTDSEICVMYNGNKVRVLGT